MPPNKKRKRAVAAPQKQGGGGDIFKSKQSSASTLLERRAEARANKDWALADKLRDKLTELGYKVQDTSTSGGADGGSTAENLVKKRAKPVF